MKLFKFILTLIALILIFYAFVYFVLFIAPEVSGETEYTDADQINISVNDSELTIGYEWKTEVKAHVPANPCNTCLINNSPSQCLWECQSVILKD